MQNYKNFIWSFSQLTPFSKYYTNRQYIDIIQQILKCPKVSLLYTIAVGLSACLIYVWRLVLDSLGIMFAYTKVLNSQ